MKTGTRFWTRFWRRTAWWFCSLAGVLALAMPAAADDPVRRVAAELTVMQGDLRQLEAPATPTAHRRGLSARLLGTTAYLRLIVREATQADGKGLPVVPLKDLRAVIQAGDTAAAKSLLAPLARRFPFDGAGIVTASPTADQLARGRYIFEELCAGCHQGPADPEADLPAHDLFAQARATPPVEFAARLIGGLRGTPANALDNPFSTPDMAAVFGYVTTGP